jgi:hypothetical protein
MSVGISGSVLAVHDEDFQLDGDTDPAISQNTPGDPANDWQSLFNADGTPTDEIDPEAATGFNDGAFERDFLSKTGKTGACTEGAGQTFCTADATTFATGSKDTLDIDTGWQCNRDNNVNSKIDIMNAYAAQYIDPGSSDQIMYFGMDKNKDNGNNNVAFWFLQSDASCTSPGGAVNFTGSHVDGDVLVVSAFTNGGGVSNINAYRWDGDDSCIDNPLLGTASDCDGQPIGSGGDCKVNTTGGDSICATTNSGPLEENDDITTSWLTSDATLGVGHTVVTTDFFEGGINLTKVFENAGGVPSCFSTFIGNTRSSQELTATLFDFARGQLGGCETSLTTDAGDTDNGGSGTPADMDDGSVSSGTDTATLTVEGTDTWAGTLTWYLCGPDAALTTCDPEDGVEVTSRAVDQDSSGADFVSGTATLTSAGKYCWTAVFDPDDATEAAGVDGAQDDGTDECFTVDPVTPTLTTDASCTSSPCVLGVDTISDTAELTGTANQPGDDGPSTVYPSINATNGAAANSAITWKLYAPGECDSGTPLVDTSRDVSGDGTYPTGAQTAVSYTPSVSDGTGDYVWVASYPGDSPNTNAAATTGCDDADETITLIGTASSSSEQNWLPNDTVTLTSNGGALDGNLTVTLYEGTFTVTDGVCTPDDPGATAVPDQQYTFDTTGDASGTTYDTSNVDFLVDATNDGDYFWLVEYDDANFTDPNDHCESTSIDITD